jgi:NADH dehydrogenase FAD-containing subunit
MTRIINNDNKIKNNVEIGMAKIVILGAGIGGVPMAYEMKEMVNNDHEVVVISDSPTFHFVPYFYH